MTGTFDDGTAAITAEGGSRATAAEAGAFSIVGIGASAGGLEPLRQLFGALDTATGMAFVVIQHLDPERPSMLTSVLEASTPLPAVEITDGMRVTPNRVHVIAPGFDLKIERGTLRLVDRQLTGRLHLPINSFFRSLAAECEDRAIGVILSGSGSDGAEGLELIKAEGGIAMAQEPASAQFPGMPSSAIASGAVDFRGTPEMIAEELGRLSRHPYVAAPTRAVAESAGASSDRDNALATVLALLRQHAGVDFSDYKHTTVLRRIERRMALCRVGRLEDYARLIEGDPAEARALARDTLIHVTSFFRDPEAFVALQREALTGLLERKGKGEAIRIWVPGCSTGEEVYSIAICLLECLDRGLDGLSVKVFGTDLSEEAVETARLGRYADAAVAGVSPERLSRFFDRVDGGYQIGRQVRDLCVFVRHDLTRDPPFARLDLVSCRNVLIYFDTELQRRLMPMLHHCLEKQGHLFLGQSETIGGFGELFAPVDREHRIFVKKGESVWFVHPVAAAPGADPRPMAGKLTARRLPSREAQRQVDHILLTRYAPPGVLVNERLEVVEFRGRTGAYLEQPPGQLQANLLRMARGDLVAHLHDAFERAKAQSAAVRKGGLRVVVGGEVRVLDLEVMPLASGPETTERYFLVLFDEQRTPVPEGGNIALRQPPPAGDDLGRVRAELVATKDYLQALISDHQVSSDELADANSEMTAANEELQSTNEELQSAKEELQSTNEELSTVNDQLRTRNLELDQVASDLVNVLASVEIPVIIVDLGLRVRRFTPTASDIASFIPEDVGRPIDDLKLKLRIDDLSGRIRGVIDAISPVDWEVQAQDGRWFRMQIRPYRTTDGRLDGAVLAFVDVDVLEKARQEAEAARDYARSVVETVTTALVVLDDGLRVLSANPSFVQKFASVTDELPGTSLFELIPMFGRTPLLRRTLEESMANTARFSALEITVDLGHGHPRILSFTGRPIVRDGHPPMMLLAVEDVTELRALEKERALLLASEQSARLEAERANHAKDLFLATLSHELRTPLSTLLLSAQGIKNRPTDEEGVKRATAAIERAAHAQAKLIDDLLDVSRIVSGKLLLDLGPVDFEGVVRGAIDIVRPAAEAKALTLELVVEGVIGTVYGDELRLLQVVNNLLTNAIKFTPRGGRISVRLERLGEEAELTVTDTGMGIPPDVLPSLFNRFVQADASVTRTHGGLGLGLSIARHLVEVHGGVVTAESAGAGKGATFRVRLPISLSAAATGAAQTPMNVQRIEGARVLLVEDNDDSRAGCAAILRDLGADVRAEASAGAAFAAIEAFHPDVILSDIAMPGEDGYSFIRRVRSLPPERGGLVPAAALTAMAGDDDRQQAKNAGFQLHVRKPFDSAQLTSVVAALLAGAKRASGQPQPAARPQAK